jgi:hypothetical protein
LFSDISPSPSVSRNGPFGLAGIIWLIEKNFHAKPRIKGLIPDFKGLWRRLLFVGSVIFLRKSLALKKSKPIFGMPKHKNGIPKIKRCSYDCSRFCLIRTA